MEPGSTCSSRGAGSPVVWIAWLSFWWLLPACTNHIPLGPQSLSLSPSPSLPLPLSFPQPLSGYFFKNGEVFAVPHHVVKHPKPVCHDIPTSEYRQRFSQTNTPRRPHSARPTTATTPARTTPSRPSTSGRARPSSSTGKMAVTHPHSYKTHPAKKTNIKFQDGSRSQFTTTYRSGFGPSSRRVPTGFNNPGIMAETTRWIHKRQED